MASRPAIWRWEIAKCVGAGVFCCLVENSGEMGNAKELISPAQAAFYVLLASILVTLIGAGLGFYAAKNRGLIAGLCGPLVFVLWQVHNVLTERFGLDSLPLLVAEIVGFVALGVILGKVWNRVVAFK